ncbi:MAG: TonB-dependent receptor, partial [Verrucomicrobia bacterium]|nr:TonB-dependent receptor [Verrucomicrobiota bacterium]
SFTTGPTSSAGGTLPGFLDKTANVGLSFRGFRLDLRLQANYRGEYLTSNSTTAALVQYQKAKTTWNWKSRYTISRGLNLFLDLENIFSEPLDTIYSAYPDRVTRQRLFHTKIIGGITGRF